MSIKNLQLSKFRTAFLLFIPSFILLLTPILIIQLLLSAEIYYNNLSQTNYESTEEFMDNSFIYNKVYDELNNLDFEFSVNVAKKQFQSTDNINARNLSSKEKVIVDNSFKQNRSVKWKKAKNNTKKIIQSKKNNSKVKSLLKKSIEALKNVPPQNKIPNIETPTDLDIDSVLFAFSNHAKEIYNELNEQDLKFEAFKFALQGYYNLKANNKLTNDNILSIADFSKSGNEERLFVIDLDKKAVIIKSLVAHGRNTGQEFASKFSNNPNSSQSSIGFFITDETYKSKKGYALRLNGMEQSNSKVRSRGVVIHGADYVSFDFIKRNGRLGRSNGCPAIPTELTKKIIDTIKNKSCFFIYYPDNHYLNISQFINSKKFLNYFRDDV